MGHEIFLKIFDGPQNIFLCPIFVILFFKLRGLQHKISNWPSRRFKKGKTCYINHIDSADIRQMVVKFFKKMFDAF